MATSTTYRPIIHFGVMIIDRIASPTFSYDPLVGLFDLERKLKYSEKKQLLSEADAAYQEYLTLYQREVA